MDLPADPWSYLCGLFEGRGWITTARKKGGRPEYAYLGVAALHDPEPLLAAQGFLGGGRVNGPYVRHGGGVVDPGDYRGRYVFLLTRREDIDPFLRRVYEFLSPEKRSEVYIAMARDTRQPKWSEPL